MQLIWKRIFTGTMLLLGFLWMEYSAIPLDSVSKEGIAAPQIGFLAPDFQLITTDGHAITLSDLRGNPVLINFWATWCPPCRAEMPGIQHIYEEYRDRGLTVIGVNAVNQDSSKAAAVFIEQYQLTFTFLLDEGEVQRLYHIRSLPTTFFVGRDGIIREIVIGGPMAEALLRSYIEILLEETQ
jgi:cytochrome c biogenesis protein CcmG/thiol:disulfide interchange protein DsbE